MISVVTVPHTGTIYTLELLKRWGIPWERKHLENNDAPPYGNDRFGPGFPCPSSDYWEAYPNHRRIVCTLRDPILAVISAVNRRVPDRDISVDGWAVMADWYERRLGDVHFFPIPPTRSDLVQLATFAGAPVWMLPDVDPMNTFEDRLGLHEAYFTTGRPPDQPSVQKAVEHLAEMPGVERLFRDHGFDSLPWYRGAA